MHSVLSKIDQVIFSLNNISGKYMYISDSCEKVYGYTSEEFISKPLLWMDLIHPDDISTVNAHQLRVLKGETLFYQYRIRHKNGSTKWIEAKSIPTLNSNNFMERLDVIVTDITERKIAQEKLELAHKELDKLFNTINEVLFSVDMVTYKIIHISAACFKVYGYTPEEFYNTQGLWSNVIHPEDKSIAQSHQEALFRGEQVENQYRIIHKDGGVRWIENKIIPTLNSAGQVTRIDGVTSDVTRRKQAQLAVLEQEKELLHSKANLSAVIENTDAQIYSIDKEFRYITYNKSLEAAVRAYAGIDIKPGDRVFEFLEVSNPVEAAAWKAVYEQAFTGASNHFIKDFSTPEKPGFVSFSLTPIWENEKVIGLSCFARDITQQKLAEQEILSLNQSLEEKVKARTHELELVNAELESFSYSISHDLRAPLRIIHGFGNMLLDSCAHKLNEEELETLGIIMKSSKHMGALIDDLLDFSRLGRLPIEKRDFNMDDLVTVTVEEAKMSYPKCNVEITKHSMGNAKGDPSLLRQVWGNLVSNAIKYSAKSERAFIEIGTTVIDGILTYYIKDNGAGFDMQYADKLFAVFQRLHKVTEYEGTGVGLALANRIICKHGGKIWAEAEPNKGATFYFTLPHFN